MIQSVYWRRTAAVALVACSATLFAGCSSNNQSPNYPPANTDLTNVPPPAMVKPADMAAMIPAGSTLLSEGTYSQIAFKVPTTPGLVWILDTTNKTIIKTNALPGGDQSVTMTDLKNVSHSLSPDHNYQIWFVPSQPTTSPSQPS